MTTDEISLDEMEAQSPFQPHTIRHRLKRKNPLVHYYRKKNRLKNGPSANSASKKSNNTTRIVVGIMLFFLSCFFYYFYGDYLTFSSLRDHQMVIIGFIEKYPILSPFSYVLCVVIVVGLSIPGATVLSMAGGLFFKQPMASVYAWIGCGFGALFCYLFVRYLFSDYFQSKLNSILNSKNNKYNKLFNFFQSGLEENELLYLIYVRFMIVIPFWLVNVAAALLPTKFNNFLVSTFIATIPGSVLYTTAGRGLNLLIQDSNKNITTFKLLQQVFWTPDIQYSLMLLLICILIPLILKKCNIFNSHKKQKKYRKYMDDFIDSSDDTERDLKHKYL